MAVAVGAVVERRQAQLDAKGIADSRRAAAGAGDALAHERAHGWALPAEVGAEDLAELARLAPVLSRGP